MALERRPGGIPPDPRRAERSPPYPNPPAGPVPRLVLPGTRLLLRRARARARPLLGPDRLLLSAQRRHRDRASAQLEGVALLREPLHRTGRPRGRRGCLG